MRLASLLCLLGITCCNRTPAPAVHAGLGGEAVARVGNVSLPASLVGQVAGAQRTDVRTALDRLIDDALAAQAAVARGDDRDPAVTWSTTAILGRAVAERIRSAALDAGPPTDQEIAQLSRLHWTDIDLPESMRVAHAVVRRPKDPGQIDAARALAARIAAAVAGATSEDDFEARANSVPRGSLEVVVQALPRFVEDGRVVSADGSSLDPAFARGAFALKKPGEISGVVESSFGWHVIRLDQRFPPKSMPLAERRAAFAQEATRDRAEKGLETVLQARRAATRIDILPDAEPRMAALLAPGPP